MGDSESIPRSGKKVTFRDEGCFVCGKSNPIGLHLSFELDREGKRATSSVTFKPEHEGWDGVVHGGLLASVLDDVMAYAIMTTGKLGITTRMSITYRKPVLVGEVLHLEGVIVSMTSRTAIAKGIGYTIDEEQGEGRIVKVEAEGTFYLDKPEGVDQE